MTSDDHKTTGPVNAAVAAALRGEKAASDLTNESLAALSQIPERSLQRYLSGERPINMDVLGRLASAMGTTSAAVLTSAEERLNRTARSGVSDDVAEGMVAYREGYGPSTPPPAERDGAQDQA